MAVEHSYRIGLDFGSPETIAVLDLSALFWDVNRIYVVGYREAVRAGVSGSSRNRESYRLPEGVQLSVRRVRYGSPFTLELVNQVGPVAIGAAAGIWALVQALEKLVQMGPSTRLLKAKARTAEVEADQAELQLHPTPSELQRLQEEVDQLRQGLHRDDPQVIDLIRGSSEIRSSMRNLQGNPLRPISIHIEDARSWNGEG
jgi:hypothetical protein